MRYHMPTFTDKPQRHDWVLLAETIQTRQHFVWRPGMAYYLADGQGPYMLTPKEAVLANAGGLPKGGYVALDEWGTMGHLLCMLAQAVPPGDPEHLPDGKAASFAHVLACILADPVPGRPVADLLNRAWRRMLAEKAKRQGKV